MAGEDLVDPLGLVDLVEGLVGLVDLVVGLED